MPLAFLAAIKVAVTVSWDGAANDGAEGTAETVMTERKDDMAASKTASRTERLSSPRTVAQTPVQQ